VWAFLGNPRDGAWVTEITGMVDVVGGCPCACGNPGQVYDAGVAAVPLFQVGDDAAQNQIWLEICALAADLIAWTQRLACTGWAAVAEPKRLRLRSFAVAGHLVRRQPRSADLLEVNPGDRHMSGPAARARCIPAGMPSNGLSDSRGGFSIFRARPAAPPTMRD